jgi:hypothetical protein
VRTLGLSALAICLFAGAARADLEYQFNVTTTGDLKPFSFSFMSATFLNDGDVPTFTPFTVTDGVSWTFTQGLVVNQPGDEGCFEFGTTPDAALLTCSVAPGSPPSAAMILSIDGGLPTATGGYVLAFSFLTSDPADFVLLGGTLDITQVPEPASIGLLGIVLAFVGWTIRKRPTGGLCDDRRG